MTEQVREPIIKAPWPALVLVAAIIAAYGWQSWSGAERLIAQYGVSGPALRRGDLAVLVTSLFLHGGWAHALTNAAFCLAFATPVARRLGADAEGAALFFIFYIVCGLVSGLVFGLCHWNDDSVAVGASGALAGFMGATSRLLTRERALAPFNSPTVLTMAVAWVAVNLLFGQLLVGWAPGSEGAPLAWQEHLAGYFAGLFLIGPTLRLLGRL